MARKSLDVNKVGTKSKKEIKQELEMRESALTKGYLEDLNKVWEEGYTAIPASRAIEQVHNFKQTDKVLVYSAILDLYALNGKLTADEERSYNIFVKSAKVDRVTLFANSTEDSLHRGVSRILFRFKKNALGLRECTLDPDKSKRVEADYYYEYLKILMDIHELSGYKNLIAPQYDIVSSAKHGGILMGATTMLGSALTAFSFLNTAADTTAVAVVGATTGGTGIPLALAGVAVKGAAMSAAGALVYGTITAVVNVSGKVATNLQIPKVREKLRLLYLEKKPVFMQLSQRLEAVSEYVSGEDRVVKFEEKDIKAIAEMSTLFNRIIEKSSTLSTTNVFTN